MRNCYYRPPAPLDRFVDFFWMIEGGESDRKERIFPSGTSEIVINLREDEIRIHDSGHPEQYQRLSGAAVSGCYSRPFICDAAQHRYIVGVHFRPGDAFPFLGPPAAELTDAHANLGDLWGSSLVRSLRTRLCESKTPRQCFVLLQDALMERIGQSPTHHRVVELALDLFGPTGTSSSTREVARELGLSQRRFIEIFATHVGLTPKLLCRILRFQRVRNLADKAERHAFAWAGQQAHSPVNWADAAVASGYYDQSHLINDFRNLSGVTPSEYVRQLRSARNVKDNHLPLSK